MALPSPSDCLGPAGPAGGALAAAVLALGWGAVLLALLALARVQAVARLEAAAARRFGRRSAGLLAAMVFATGLLGAGAALDAARGVLGGPAPVGALAPGAVVGVGIVLGALGWAALAALRRRPALLGLAGLLGAGLIALQFLLLPLVLDPVRRGDGPAPPGASAAALVDFARSGGLAADRLAVFPRGGPEAVDAEGVGPFTRLAVSRRALEGPTPETFAALGHLLGHHAHADLELLAAILILALLLKLAAARFGPAVLGRMIGRTAPAWSVAALPLIAAAALLVEPLGRIAFDYADQRVNLRADAFALALTRDPGALCRWIRADAPAGETDASGVASLLLDDHPPLSERLAAVRDAAARPPVNRASAEPGLWGAR